MRKVYLILIFTTILSTLAIFLYLYLRDTKEEHQHFEGVLLFKVDGVEVYSEEGKLRVGDNVIWIRLPEGKSLEELYFYMPPMPGMGEHRSEISTEKVSKDLYRGKVNLSMAGYWQLVGSVGGQTFKIDVNIPYTAGGVAQEEKGEGSLDLRNKNVDVIGIIAQPVEFIELLQSFSTVGYVSFDQSKVYEITVRSDGWVIDTFNRFEGELVDKGAPLLKILSPEVEIAKEELRLTTEMEAKDLSKLAREKLSYLQKGDVITSPVRGLIVEKRVFPGGSIKAGDTTYKIVDTSNLWVIAEVPIDYLSSVKVGTEVMVVRLGNKREYVGRIDYIFPEINRDSRTARVRIRLKTTVGFRINEPLEVYFEIPLGKVLAVPESAVVDTGRRQVVFVEVEKGVYQPRQVKLGRKAGSYYEVLSGLEEGERVVVKGTFFLDSEAQLKGIDLEKHQH